ncbi:hypothetical protein DFH09DRAFT_22624 [Mycena vulgaris]|nr:hypothetical protein DFH09DRAFT_22624 [Mycena vulgaris]
MLLHNPVTTPCQPFARNASTARSTTAASAHSAATPSPASPSSRTTPQIRPSPPSFTPAFPEMCAERADAIEAEERDARLDTPIFVCMLIFPGHPYRPPLFRAPLPPHATPLSRAGGSVVRHDHALRARAPAAASPRASPTMAPWSRSAASRCSPTAAAWSRPGPPTASASSSAAPSTATLSAASRESTTSPTSSPSRPRSRARPMQDLMEICTSFLLQLRRGTAPWVVQRLNNVYGPPPTDPAAFSYWVALVLPIDEYEKAKLLPIRSARMRLHLVVHWIEQLNSNWCVRRAIQAGPALTGVARWFASGCVIL